MTILNVCTLMNPYHSSCTMTQHDMAMLYLSHHLRKDTSMMVMAHILVRVTSTTVMKVMVSLKEMEMHSTHQKVRATCLVKEIQWVSQSRLHIHHPVSVTRTMTISTVYILMNPYHSSCTVTQHDMAMLYLSHHLRKDTSMMVMDLYEASQ